MDQNQALLDAIDSGDLDAFRAAMDNGANVSAADRCGQTALATKILVTFFSLIETTAQAPAAATELAEETPAQKDLDGVQGAFSAAVLEGRHEEIGALKKRGANLDQRNEYGETMLIFLMDNRARTFDESHQFLVGKALLDDGANVEARDQDGKTALMVAAQKGLTSLVHLLLCTGKATLETRDKYGQTALMWAAGAGHVDAARRLLQMGAKVNAPCCSGWTPLMLAANCKQTEIVRLLIEYGADTATTSFAGSSALSLATDKGASGVISLLGLMQGEAVGRA